MCYGALMWSNPNMEVMLFEPLPEYFAQIKAAAAGRPNVQLFNVAIGDETGEMSFIDEGTSSSLVGVASPVAQHFHRPDSEKKVVKVQVRKMSDYDHGQIDLLRVDTEGAEWFCIKHLVSRPRQIVVEIYNDIATYINPYLFEISQWAKTNGYRLTSVGDGDFIYERS